MFQNRGAFIKDVIPIDGIIYICVILISDLTTLQKISGFPRGIKN